MKEKSRIPATAVARMPQSPNGTKYATYRAKITDDAAMIPECALQNPAHARHVPVDFRRLHKDGCADDDPRHHRGGLQQADGPFQSRAFSRRRQDAPVYHGKTGP